MHPRRGHEPLNDTNGAAVPRPEGSIVVEPGESMSEQAAIKAVSQPVCAAEADHTTVGDEAERAPELLLGERTCDHTGERRLARNEWDAIVRLVWNGVVGTGMPHDAVAPEHAQHRAERCLHFGNMLQHIDGINHVEPAVPCGIQFRSPDRQHRRVGGVQELANGVDQAAIVIKAAGSRFEQCDRDAAPLQPDAQQAQPGAHVEH
jgi:hypothetical protein